MSDEGRLTRALTGLGRLAAARPRLLVALSLVVALAGVGLGSGVTERLDPYDDEDPASESARTDARIAAASGAEGQPGAVALLDLSAPIPAAARRRSPAATPPAARQEIVRAARLLAGSPRVARVAHYLEGGDASSVSRDGSTAALFVFFEPVGHKRRQDAAGVLGRRAARHPRLQLGGEAVSQRTLTRQIREDLRRAELIALPLLLALSLLFFRSVVAALLPPLIGALAILLTLAGLRVADDVGPLSVFAVNLVTALGLGLAIDYSLFMVARYREELARGRRGEAAIVATMRTAGRTVLFSGLTVAGTLAALLVFPQQFLYSMGIGGVLVVALAVGITLLLLPALLVLLGPRIDALSPRGLRSRAEREATPLRSGFWYRLARAVMRRPATVAIAASLVLLAAALPALRVDFNSGDASVLPGGSAAREVFTRMQSEFLPHTDEALRVLVAGDPAAAARVARTIEAMPAAAEVGRPRPLGPDLSLLRVVSRHGEYEDRTQALVASIRDLDARATVSGRPAQFVDLEASLRHHLPAAIAVLVLATLLALFALTGSVVLPIKALVMNVLTVAATFGLMVLVFQDGRLSGLLDFEPPGALEISQPIVFTALALGLATDYGAFLLSRVREERDAGLDDAEAVAAGMERTGRLITAAAVLFAVAMGAFATSEVVFMKEVGLGTAAAVLIDATIVRALLVPALMRLLGRWNWWAPSWLPGRRAPSAAEAAPVDA